MVGPDGPWCTLVVLGGPLWYFVDFGKPWSALVALVQTLFTLVDLCILYGLWWTFVGLVSPWMVLGRAG